MRRRWIHLGYIDTHLPLTDEQRREVEKRSNVYAGRRWSFQLKLAAVTVALPVAVIGGGFQLTVWLMIFIPINKVAGAIGYLGACAIAVFLYARLVWSWYKRPTRMALRDMGYDICVECGYWLRELRDDASHCPECGAAREAMPMPSDPPRNSA